MAGLVHCLLPLSRSDPEKAKRSPGTYTDTGVVTLLSEMTAQGALLENLIVKVAGGGAPLSSLGSSNIGNRNVAVLRKILWKNNLMIEGEDTGGSKPRTLRLNIASGETTVATGREVTVL